MTRKIEHLTHTLPIFINDDSKVLILGSFPSVKSREVMFYYGHSQNRFFKVLTKVFNDDSSIDTIEERKAFLLKHKIALYDVIEECDISGSADSSIKNVKPADIIGILREFPLIKVIGITGGKAKKLFDKYILNKIDLTKVKVVYLPSSSPANAKMSIEALAESYKSLFVIIK